MFALLLPNRDQDSVTEAGDGSVLLNSTWVKLDETVTFLVGTLGHYNPK